MQRASNAFAAPGVGEQSGVVPGQADSSVCATPTARPCARMSRPIAIASLVEPPGELIRIGRRRPPNPAMKREKDCPVPTSIPALR